MDSAWKEILADERARGREEGKTSIIQNMINRNFTDKDIRAAVRCRQKTIDEVREKMPVKWQNRKNDTAECKKIEENAKSICTL